MNLHHLSTFKLSHSYTFLLPHLLNLAPSYFPTFPLSYFFMTNAEYRSLPRVSNSDLSEFRNFLFGYAAPKPEKAFAFGSAFHEALLGDADPVLPPDFQEVELVDFLVDRVRTFPGCSWIIHEGVKETVQLFQDPITGIACKARLDLLWQGRLIVDFKTTSASTHEEFRDHCLRYHYDRQAAFYMDSLPGAECTKTFFFIGVQKVKPFDMFFLQADEGFISGGRNKYQSLLQAFKTTPFTPSAWTRDPQHKLAA
jgi:PDDEXK-like domain of unknown function (DUF3799)